jgi:hypothetical protein
MTQWPLLISAVILFASGPPDTFAQGSPASDTVDPRVQAALKGTGLSFSIDGGDFRLKYVVAGGRTQLAWVASGTASIDKLEVRDVWSVAHRAKGTVPADLATRLLQDNARMVLGAWQVNQGKDEYLVVFSVPVAAAADAETLQDVIEVVTLTADQMEKELTGDKDEF